MRYINLRFTYLLWCLESDVTIRKLSYRKGDRAMRLIYEWR